MTIQYVSGDATNPPEHESAVIVHVCNDIGGWGRGFVVALSQRYKEPEQHYRAWFQGQDNQQPFALGQVQFVSVKPHVWVANLIGQQGLRRSGSTPPVRYDAIRQGLQQVAIFAHAVGASVHMPRIGCGLAGGRWEEIEPIIESELVAKGILVTVYDLPVAA